MGIRRSFYLMRQGVEEIRCLFLFITLNKEDEKNDIHETKS
jgi:hypothetical protein